MMGEMRAPIPALAPVRAGIMFWFCLTCERVVDGKCSRNHEVAAIPPPPVDPRMN